MDKPRQFPAQETRVETGPIQFGDDWPGTFMRGKHAAHYAYVLERFMTTYKAKNFVDEMDLAVLKGLLYDLRSSSVSQPEDKIERANPSTEILGDVARSLKAHMIEKYHFLSQTTLFFVGFGQDDLHVFARNGEQWWKELEVSTGEPRPSRWRGYPVVWHYGVGEFRALGVIPHEPPPPSSASRGG